MPGGNYNFIDLLNSSSFSSSLLFAWMFRNVTATSVTVTYDEGPLKMTSSYFNAGYGVGLMYEPNVFAVLRTDSGTNNLNGGSYTYGGGAVSYAEMPPTASLNINVANVPFTIATWWQPVSVHNVNAVDPLVAKSGETGSGFWFGKKTPPTNAYDYPILAFRTTAGGYASYSATIECWGVANSPVSIAVTYDGLATTSSVIFYRSGRPFASGGWNMNVTMSNFSLTSSISTGARMTMGSNRSNYAYGKQGPTLMWTRVLTPDEIQTVMRFEEALIGTHSASISPGTSDAYGPNIIRTLRVSVSAAVGLDPRASKVNPGVN